MAQFETWLKTDLTKLPSVQCIPGMVFTQDIAANLVGVEVYKDGVAQSITGTVTGYVIRDDGNTVAVAGDSDANKAWIELPYEAYAIPGNISIVIRETVGDTEASVLCACRAVVYRSSTDAIIDPGGALPSVEELIAEIEGLEDEIGDVETQLGGVKFIRSNINANNGTVTYVFSGTCCFNVFTGGADATIRAIVYGYCTSTGTVSTSQTPSGATNIVTVTSTTNKLTIKNTSSYTAFSVLVAYGNPDNVTLQ